MYMYVCVDVCVCVFARTFKGYGCLCKLKGFARICCVAWFVCVVCVVCTRTFKGLGRVVGVCVFKGFVCIVRV